MDTGSNTLSEGPVKKLKTSEWTTEQKSQFSDMFNRYCREMGIKLMYTKFKLAGKDCSVLIRKLQPHRQDVLQNVMNGPYKIKDVLWMRIAEQMARGGVRRIMPYNCSVPGYFSFWGEHKIKYFALKRKDGGYEFHGWTVQGGKDGHK